MIDEIQVQNLALIRAAKLRPSSGMTVLTGETGAGKTALLSALRLLMGQRADKTAIREGTEMLEVSGRFFSSVENGSNEELSEQVIVRSVALDGRSRVEINGKMASVSQLTALVGDSVDLCGQHDQQQLMKIASHGHLLDAWAGDSVRAALEAYQSAYAASEEARLSLNRLEELVKSSSEELENARFVLQQIDAVDPVPQEYEQLSADLERAEHAEALARAAFDAFECLGGEAGAQEGLARALHVLDAAAPYDEALRSMADALREAEYVVEDVLREVSSYRDGVDFDSDDLQQQQERMAQLQGLLRAFGPRMEDVFERRDAARSVVSAVDDSAFLRERAQKALQEAEERLFACAERLSEQRRLQAPRFAAAVSEQMARLEMQGARLVCDLRDLPRELWTKTGSQAIEFLFQPAEGMQARPLARIASGGELSRVMLAIKVVLGQADQVETLVFDEVDAGVGGSTALALAEVLADLAKTHQVIAVTHLAQIAAAADTHYLVRKIQPDSEADPLHKRPAGVSAAESPDRKEGASAAGSPDVAALPETHLVRLSEEERPAEIARMLSGSVTEASLAAAREMLS